MPGVRGVAVKAWQLPGNQDEAHGVIPMENLMEKGMDHEMETFFQDL